MRHRLATSTATGIAGALVTLTALAAGDALAAFPLVTDTRAAPIVVDRQAPQRVTEAVDDLVDAIARATGKRPEVRRVGGTPPASLLRNAVAVGTVADLPVTEAEVGYDGYRIRATDTTLELAGPTPAGTANAVYDFLRNNLGVLYLVPGDGGIYAPQLSSVAVPRIDRRERPAFALRYPWFNDNVLRCYSDSQRADLRRFVRRNRGMGIGVDAQHYFDALIPTDQYFATHPEYFAEVDGERRPNGQRCTSNPDVLRIAVNHWNERFTGEPDLRIGSLTPNDGGLYCTCDACKLVSASLPRRLITFMNEVTRRVVRQHPDRSLTFYAYGPLAHPVEAALHPHLIPAVTRYLVCQAHDIDNAACRSNAEFRADLDGWRQLSERFLVREYACWWHAPDLALDVLAANLRTYHSLGALGVSREYLRRGFGADLVRYLDLQLLWNPDQDLDALTDEFLNRRFGPSAAGVRGVIDEFRRTLEATDPTDPITGNDLEINRVYTRQQLARGVETLAELAERAEPPYRQRLAAEAALLEASHGFRLCLSQKQRYSVTGDRSDLDELVRRLDAAIDHAGAWEAQGLLGCSYRAELAALRDQALGGGLTRPIGGPLVYRDGLENGGWSRRDASRIEGFYAGQYGLALLPGRNGRIDYTFRSAPGTTFTAARLTDLVFRGTSTEIRVKVDGAHHLVARDVSYTDPQLTHDIGRFVAGASEFTLTFTATNRGGRPALVLDSWGIDLDVR